MISVAEIEIVSERKFVLGNSRCFGLELFWSENSHRNVLPRLKHCVEKCFFLLMFFFSVDVFCALMMFFCSVDVVLFC
jgi:hypothetical protein